MSSGKYDHRKRADADQIGLLQHIGEVDGAAKKVRDGAPGKVRVVLHREDTTLHEIKRGDEFHPRGNIAEPAPVSQEQGRQLQDCVREQRGLQSHPK